jgi:hypothetical protein
MAEEDKPVAECDTTVLLPSGGSRWLALAIGIGGVVAGMTLVAEAPAFAVCAVLLFGIIALGAILQFWPGAAYLKITPNGFEVHNVRQHFFVPWADVEEFSVRRVGKAERVVFKLTESSSLKVKRGRILRWLVPGDVDGLLPYAYGGFTLEELASRLNLWRQNALQLEGQEPPRHRTDGHPGDHSQEKSGRLAFLKRFINPRPLSRDRWIGYAVGFFLMIGIIVAAVLYTWFAGPPE